MCLAGPGSKGASFYCMYAYVKINHFLIDHIVFDLSAVPWESGGPSDLAAEPLFQSDGGGGQQTQPCNPASQNDHGNVFHFSFHFLSSFVFSFFVSFFLFFICMSFIVPLYFVCSLWAWWWFMPTAAGSLNPCPLTPQWTSLRLAWDWTTFHQGGLSLRNRFGTSTSPGEAGSILAFNYLFACNCRLPCISCLYVNK